MSQQEGPRRNIPASTIKWKRIELRRVTTAVPHVQKPDRSDYHLPRLQRPRLVHDPQEAEGIGNENARAMTKINHGLIPRGAKHALKGEEGLTGRERRG